MYAHHLQEHTAHNSFNKEAASQLSLKWKRGSAPMLASLQSADVFTELLIEAGLVVLKHQNNFY